MGTIQIMGIIRTVCFGAMSGDIGQMSTRMVHLFVMTFGIIILIIPQDLHGVGMIPDLIMDIGFGKTLGQTTEIIQIAVAL